MPEDETLADHKAWAELSAQGLALAYSDDEPEYTQDDLKPENEAAASPGPSQPTISGSEPRMLPR